MRSQVRIQCPNCPPDKSPALSVNRTTGMYHCFRCGISGKMKGHFRFEGAPEISHSSESLPWPEGYKPLLPRTKGLARAMAWKYLERRGIEEWQVERYKIGFCEEGPYTNRVIVPVLQGIVDPKLVYFVARSINPMESRKYLNPPSAKAGVVFRTFIGQAPRAVIVEGVFDALRVEHVAPAIALLTKKATLEQLHTIAESCQEALLLLDSDAAKDSLALGGEIGFYVPLKRLYLREGDPGSTSVPELRKLIQKGEIYGQSAV